MMIIFLICSLNSTVRRSAGWDGTLQLTGDFVSAGKPVLAFRLHGKKN